MIDHVPRRAAVSAGPRTPLLRLRLKKGDTRIVRLLSETYKGCLTHWVKGRSRYCPGPDTCDNHSLDAVWKGYCSVEVYTQEANLWIPWVLEITESLDQDFHGVFSRGQVWELRYEVKKSEGGGAKVFGMQWQALDPFTLPEPYDMRPVIESTYHRPDVRLTVDNPMPRRIMAEPSRGAAPVRPGSAQARPEVIDPAILEALKERAKGKAPGDGNGRHP